MLYIHIGYLYSPCTVTVIHCLYNVLIEFYSYSRLTANVSMISLTAIHFEAGNDLNGDSIND